MSVALSMAGGRGGPARRAFARHVGLLTAMNLVWEFAQMPLYTLWRTGTPGEIAWSGLHCTLGDALIGAAALGVALILRRPVGWPRQDRLAVVLIAVGIGLGYVVFSEWLNVEVRGAWAYAEAMPVIPWLGTGLTPVLQWLTLPVAAYLLATGGAQRPDGASGETVPAAFPHRAGAGQQKRTKP